jgi:hypothetical protein
MTLLPADRLGLARPRPYRRGAPRRHRDLRPRHRRRPRHLREPHQYPDGIPYVIVNGVVTVDGGSSGTCGRRRAAPRLHGTSPAPTAKPRGHRTAAARGAHGRRRTNPVRKGFADPEGDPMSDRLLQAHAAFCATSIPPRGSIRRPRGAQAVRRIPVFDQVLKHALRHVRREADPARVPGQRREGRDRVSSPWSGNTTSKCARRSMCDAADLFVSQTPLVNAGAYGMDRPFIVLNSGTSGCSTATR